MAEIIVNQVIGAIIGAIVSIIISWYFYKKADIGTRIASEMTHDVLELMIFGILQKHLQRVNRWLFYSV